MTGPVPSPLAPGDALRSRRGRPRASLWVLGLAALIILLDAVLSEQITIGVLYVLPVLAGFTLDSERVLYALTGIVIVAIFAVFLAFPNDADFRFGLLNRGLSAIAMLAIAPLVARQIRYRRELDEQRRRLAALMELQGDFVRAVGHDIRSPVGAILGYVELLESSTGVEPLSPRQSKMLAGIERSCRHVVALTDNLLTTASLDAGDFPVEQAPFDLVAVVRDVATEASLQPRGNGRIRLETPPALPVVSDALRVRQIVLNLLTNAIKYSPPDQPVTVRVEDDGGEVWVQVTDRGPGIPAEEHERIFEPFYQSSTRRKGGGVGLGLPLARRLARILGGDLTLRSEPGEGSEFTLRLPDGSDTRAAG